MAQPLPSAAYYATDRDGARLYGVTVDTARAMTVDRTYPDPAHELKTYITDKESRDGPGESLETSGLLATEAVRAAAVNDELDPCGAGWP
jgi:hypothetical protein